MNTPTQLALDALKEIAKASGEESHIEGMTWISDRANKAIAALQAAPSEQDDMEAFETWIEGEGFGVLLSTWQAALKYARGTK